MSAPVCCTRWAVIYPDGEIEVLTGPRDAEAVDRAGRIAAFYNPGARVACVELREVVPDDRDGAAGGA